MVSGGIEVAAGARESNKAQVGREGCRPTLAQLLVHAIHPVFSGYLHNANNEEVHYPWWIITASVNIMPCNIFLCSIKCVKIHLALKISQ